MLLRSSIFFLGVTIVLCVAASSEESLGLEQPVESESLQSSEKDLTKELEQSLESEETLDSALTEVLEDEEDFEDDEKAIVQLLGLASFVKKLRNCVRKVDKSKLKQAEKKILVSCILPALKGALNPQAIAARYAKCVVKKNVKGPGQAAARKVVGCMRK